MTAQRQQLLDQALELSQQMAQLGEAGEWQQVIALESQRSALLHDALSSAVPADEVTVRQIGAILAADKRLMGLGVTARDEAASELSQLQRGRKVKQAYRNIGA